MPSPVCLSESLIAFLEGGVSIMVASCDVDGDATIGRALACEVSEGEQAVTIYFDAAANRANVAAIEATGKVAVVFSEPSTHRSVQIKGLDGCIGPVDPHRLRIIARRIAAFIRDLERAGYPRTFGEPLMAYDPDHLVALTFTVVAVYDQTPGPKAGQELRP